MAVLVQDTFTDTNDTTLTNHTPDIDTVGSGWVARLGSAKIYGNKATNPSAGATFTTINANESDVDIEADFYTANPNTNLNIQVGFMLRWADSSNFLIARYKWENQFVLDISKWVNGVESSLGSTSYSWPYNTTHTLRVVANGPSIKLYVDDVEKISVTESFNQTETDHGIFIASQGNNETFGDNFLISTISSPDANVNATVQSSTISLPTVGVTTVKNEEVSAGVQSSTVSQVDPSITAVKNIEILPNEVSLGIDQPSIDVEAAKNVSSEVVVQEITLIQNDPVVEADINALVSLVENILSLTQNEASVETVKNTEVVLDEIDVNALLNSPDVSTTLGTPVTPDVIESTISINSPTVQVSGRSNIRILINEEGELFFEMLQSAGGV